MINGFKIYFWSNHVLSKINDLLYNYFVVLLHQKINTWALQKCRKKYETYLLQYRYKKKTIYILRPWDLYEVVFLICEQIDFPMSILETGQLP